MSDTEDLPHGEPRMAFVAGLKRKRIDFVPAGAETASAQAPSKPTSAGDRYLSIVFKNAGFAKKSIDPLESATEHDFVLNKTLCEICDLPMGAPDDAPATTATPHEASVAHMVCMKHSYPPSHLDRSRQGLKYLSSYGWDPDSRVGLGASGEGIRAPIKAKVKNDTVGLGVDFKEIRHVQRKKVESLNAKQSKKKDIEDRKKRERLQELFYRSDDVEKYFGGA